MTALPAWTPPNPTRSASRFPDAPEYVRLGRLALAGLAHVRLLSIEELGDLKLALTEACALRRRSRDARSSYEIRYEVHDDRLVVEVVDGADGYVDGSSAAPGLDVIRRSPTRSS